MPLRTTALHELTVARERQVRGAPITGVPLKLFMQQRNNWCWAACVEMVLKQFNVSKDCQCKTARKGLSLRDPRFKGVCCAAIGYCKANDARECDKTLDDCTITRLWNEGYGIKATRQELGGVTGAVLNRKLVELLNGGSPVEMGYQSTTGHVVILYGHDKTAGSQKFNFYFRNPAAPEDLVVSSDSILRTSYGALNAKWEIPLYDRARWQPKRRQL